MTAECDLCHRVIAADETSTVTGFSPMTLRCRDCQPIRPTPEGCPGFGHYDVMSYVCDGCGGMRDGRPEHQGMYGCFDQYRKNERVTAALAAARDAFTAGKDCKLRLTCLYRGRRGREFCQQGCPMFEVET